MERGYDFLGCGNTLGVALGEALEEMERDRSRRITVTVEGMDLRDGGVMAAFGDREREEWVVASSFVRSQNPQTSEVMHRIIESVACSSLRAD